jgi:hypothetical protein
MPTSTFAHMNVKSAVFTPSGGGSAVTLRRLLGANFNDGIEVVKGGGDGDFYNTINAPSFADPTVQLTLREPFAAAAIVGVIGTLVINLPDSVNGMATGGGGRIVTLSNALLQGRGHSHGWRQLSSANLEFGAASSDGVTSPLSVAAA